MRPRAPRGVLPGALGLALCCLCGALGPWRSGDHGWKKLIMVHHWPTTVCKEIENACSDPPDYWTIHGLWQALNGSVLSRCSHKRRCHSGFCWHTHVPQAQGFLGSQLRWGLGTGL
uniref:Ribonuclease T2 n=1 Tax=Equus caballus TaxID=9796 RepID=A0A3Q2I8V3_HORSE